jgi:inward rectifier potassium channel
MRDRPKRIRSPGADYEIRIIGDRPTPLRDFYHLLMRLSWPATLAMIAGFFLIANTVFAFGFLCTGGIAHARSGSFGDAFFFSAQTIGTIGYGAMYPETLAANVLVVTESIVGIILTALVTGLLFAKFSRPTARVVFTREAVISPMNGVPTLMLRLGNQRGNQIVNVQIRATLYRTERTAEGNTFYRMIDLKLARDHTLTLSRSWTLLHPIDENSPFHGQTPESLEKAEVEMSVLVVGLDDTSMQTIHAGQRYFARQILWGSRHRDIVAEAEDGAVVVDLRRFHDVEPTPPAPGFPYPA